MVKEAYYFSHDSNAKTDEKILDLRSDLGWEGYGIYWALIETLRDTANHKFPKKSLPGLSINLSVKREKLEKIIFSFGLFESDEEFFWSDSLLRRMSIKEEKKEKAKEAANKRWEKWKQKHNSESDSNAYAMKTHSDSITDVEPMQSDSNAIKGKERKGNKKKGKEIKVKENNKEELLPSGNSLYKNFIEVYDLFIKSKTGFPAKIDEVQGASMKKLIQYLSNASKEKNEEGGLKTWQYILNNWGSIEDFYQSKLKLTEINSNIVNILAQIKNGKKIGPNNNTKNLNSTINIGSGNKMGKL